MRSKFFKSELMNTAILLIVCIISVAGFWLALRAALRTEYPLHAVVSGSMTPTLNIGDLLVVQGVLNACEIYAAPAYKNGDVIVFYKPKGFRDPNDLIVHRALDKFSKGGTWYFTTKGDNNPAQDYWDVPEDYLIGKVVGRIPLLGYLKIFLGTPVGMAVIILLIVILLFADYIPLIRREAKALKTNLYKNLIPFNSMGL